MKRSIALLLTAVMVFALCVCGGTSEAANSTAEEEGPAVIEFTGVVLVDDDTVKIELVNFYEQEYNWSSGRQIEKCITFKVTNKSDHKIVLNPGKWYLNNEEVSVSGYSIVPDPGRSGNYDFLVQYKTTPDKTPLSSLDELYGLEGSLDGVNVYEDSSRNTHLTVEFSIPDALGDDPTAEDGKPAVVYQVGDTVSTDVVEFTLTGFDYVQHLDPTTYAEKADITGGSIGPGKGMVFANPEYSIKNISKGSIQAYDVVEFSVDYNDGYMFGMSDGKMSYIVDTPGIFVKWFSKGFVDGKSLAISPLSSEEYDAYIPANILIETDTEAPLLLVVTLATSTATEDFVYQIR